ncbi:MAG: hypothetical protein IJT25_01855 [Clostridia bacterium]|nr:hypothetical protein [Clostridia bacterium]
MKNFYDRITCKIISIKNSNKNIEIINLGCSENGKHILGLFFNFKSESTFIIHASIHAREFITTSFALSVAKKLANLDRKHTQKLPNILIVPLVNPDGVMLAKIGLKSVKNHKKRRFLCNINGKNANFKLFKANINGVDLNNNFDADFNLDPRYKHEPSIQGYPGKCPSSEKEVQVLLRAVEIFKPSFTISLHTKGEEIYYDFKLKKEQINAHKKLANIFAKKLEYKLVDGYGLSCGGFKDYCICKLKIPSITIEMASDYYSYPLPKQALCDILKKTDAFISAIEEGFQFLQNNKNQF